jgi:hypothetical protein
MSKLYNRVAYLYFQILWKQLGASLRQVGIKFDELLREMEKCPKVQLENIIFENPEVITVQRYT